MQTRTYAEILARQGEFQAAMAIYRTLIGKTPNDASLVRRLAEIQKLSDSLLAPPPRAKSRAEERLETFLHRIQSRRR